VDLLNGLSVPQVVIHTKKLAPKTQQTKKAATKGSKKTVSRPESESESSDESELEIEAPDEPSPIPPVRPTEPEAAAQYDTLQAVWSPRNKWPGPEKVKNALVAYKDLIKALRDAWKEQVQAMKLAENQGDNSKALQLKEQVILQRRIMDKIATTTLEMGHPNIVEKYVFPFKPQPQHQHHELPYQGVAMMAI
jgi:Sec-independent protein translocase protein TatA